MPVDPSAAGGVGGGGGYVRSVDIDEWDPDDRQYMEPREPPTGGGWGGGGPPEQDVVVGKAWYNSQTNLSRMLGNWWFPYDIFVVPQPNGDLLYYAPDFVGAAYVWDAVNQKYASPPGFFDVMVQNGDGTWTRTTRTGQQWHFNTAGYLVWMKNRYGLQTTINRGAQNQILSIDDYAGRRTTISYYANGYASMMTDWGNRSISFGYDQNGYLTSVTYPSTTFFDRATGQIVTRNKVISLLYTSGTGTNNDGNLTGVVDDLGNSMMSNAFDSSDRATSTTVRGGTWSYSYQGGTTTVVDPDGVTILYSFNAAGATTRKEVFTKTGLGQAPLRQGEPNSYVWQYARGGACGCNLVTRVTNPDGSYIDMTYDLNGRMTSRIHNDGQGNTSKETWTWTAFSQFSQLLTYVPPRGNESGANAADHTTTYARDALGNATSITYPKATVDGVEVHPAVTMTYDGQGSLLTHTANSGTVTKYEYKAVSLEPTKVIRDFGGLDVTWQYTYDTFSRRVTASDPRGHVTTTSYNALNLITEVAPPQPESSKTTYLYDNNDRLYRVEVENKDAAGNVDGTNPWFTTTFDYNTSGQLTSETAEIDATTTAQTQYEYTAGSRLFRITDPNGNKTEIVYDERGYRFKVTLGAGTSAAGTYIYNYDLDGNLAEVVDPRGFSATYSHDYMNRLLDITFADGTKVAWTIDADGNVLETESLDSQGVVVRRTRWTYDPYGLTTARTLHHLDGAGSTTQTDTWSFTHGPGLSLKMSANPLGNTITLTRDALGRIIKVEDPIQDRVELSYDVAGNLIKEDYFLWNQVVGAHDRLVRDFEYDPRDLGTLVRRRDPGSTLTSEESVEYDGRANPTKTVDAEGNTIHFEWDGLHRRTKVIRDLRAGGTGAGTVQSTIDIVYAYDLGGRLTSITNGLGKTTTYTYDSRSRVTIEQGPSGGTTTFTRDANGNPTSITDRVGNGIAGTYDSMNRLVARTIARATGVLGTTTETYTYDALGRLLTAVDDDSTVQRVYDSLGRLTGETQGPNPLGGAGKTFSFSWDAAGSHVATTFPDGTIEQRTRDAAARLSSVAIQGGSTLANYLYSGRDVARLSLQNSVTRDVTRDALRRHTMVEYKQNTTSLKKFEYVWNLADQRLLEKRHHSGGAGDNYKLDSLYRTIEVKAGVADPVAEHQNPGSQTVTSTTALSLDAGQNRTQVSVTTGGTPTVTNYAPDSLNFYISVGGTTHVRDANGNLKDDGSFLYDYDYRDQLLKVTKKSDSSVVATYEYDMLGRRISKTASAGTRSFYWIGKQLGAEYDAQGLFSRRHYGGGFGRVVSAQQRDVADLDQDGSTTDYIPITPLYDGAFDCAGALDHTGAVAESYVHTYEGAVTITGPTGQPLTTSAIGWQQGFGGLYRDDETAFLYTLFRHYDPGVGRFITADPLGAWFDAGNAGNSYGWAGNRYRNGADPLGLVDGHAIGIAIGVGLTAAAHAAVSDAADEVATAIDALNPAAQTDEMQAIADEVQADDVSIVIVSEEAWPAEDHAASMTFRRTGSRLAPGQGRGGIGVKRDFQYEIKVRYNLLWADGRTYANMVFNLVHELLHVGKHTCGDYGLHHETWRETLKFNREVKRIIGLLLDKSPKLKAGIGNKLDRAARRHGIR